MSWLGWLFAAWGGAIVAVVAVWAWLGGLSRARYEDAKLDLVWEQFVEGASFRGFGPGATATAAPMSRRKYLFRVARQDDDRWVPVRDYQSSTAARHRACALSVAAPGVSYRVERSGPVTFDAAPAVYTLAIYNEGVAS